MTIHKIFSPYIYHVNLKNNDFLKDKTLPSLLKNKNKKKSLVPNGWLCDVFSTYTDAFSNPQYENKTKYSPYRELDNRETERFDKYFDNTPLLHTYRGEIINFLEELSLVGYNNTHPTCGFNIDMWYNTYSKNQYQEWHDHSGGDSDFSAIHFLKYDEDEHIPTIFRNPTNRSKVYSSIKNKKRLQSINNNYNSIYSDIFYPNIKEGDLLIFPSWLEHTVPPNKSKNLRITVAFNIELL